MSPSDSGIALDPVTASARLRPAAEGSSPNGADSRILDKFGRNSYNESMKAILSEKGQVTVPKPLRDRLGLRTGQVLDFELHGGTIVVRKALPSKGPVDAVYGILSGFDVDRSLEQSRGKAWNPEMDQPRAHRRR